jgi:hypothetical protein
MDPVMTSSLVRTKVRERRLRVKDYGSLDLNNAKDLEAYAAAAAPPRSPSLP